MKTMKYVIIPVFALGLFGVVNMVMASSGVVNTQVTDAVTQANVKSVSEQPAVAEISQVNEDRATTAD